MSKPFQELVAHTTRTIVANSTNNMVRQALHVTSADEPLIADDDKKAEVLAAVIAMAHGGSELTQGLLMACAGVVLSLVPKKGLELTTLEVQFNSPDTNDEPTITTKVTDWKLAPREGGKLLYKRHAETYDCETGALTKGNQDVDESRIARPRIPGVDDPTVTIDYANTQKPTYYTKATHNIGGVGVISAGIGTMFSGAYKIVTGASTVVVNGTQQVSNLIRGTSNS